MLGRVSRGEGDMRVGALERGGPRPRGRQPSSEADPARGGVSLRARRTSLEGASALERGGPRPRGRSAVPLWRAAGATRAVNV
jgi:hypothetical protein